MKEEEEKTKKKPNWALQVPPYCSFENQTISLKSMLAITFLPPRTPCQPSPSASWGRRAARRGSRWRKRKRSEEINILIMWDRVTWCCFIFVQINMCVEPVELTAEVRSEISIPSSPTLMIIRYNIIFKHLSLHKSI